jgi:hypothetical protein
MQPPLPPGLDQLELQGRSFLGIGEWVVYLKQLAGLLAKDGLIELKKANRRATRCLNFFRGTYAAS